MAFWDTVKKAIASIAPAIGNALGGPFGGLAAQKLTQALGLTEDASPDEIAQTIANASPDLILKIKQTDNEFELERQRLSNQNTSDARNNANELIKAGKKDWVRPTLTFVIVFSFIGAVAAIWKLPIDPGMKDTADLLVGQLSAAAWTVIKYYFGG